MDSSERDFLRSVISVALAVAPRAWKRAFAERKQPQSDQAQRHLAESVSEAVVQVFDVSRKPDPAPGRGVPARPES